MVRGKKEDQPRLVESPLAKPDEVTRKELLAGRRAADPALDEYLRSLQASNCPSCDRPQRTPQGEPMLCPACTGKAGTMDRPSVPMGYGGRRQ